MQTQLFDGLTVPGLGKTASVFSTTTQARQLTEQPENQGRLEPEPQKEVTRKESQQTGKD